MKTFKLRLAAFTLAAAAILGFLFSACQKDDSLTQEVESIPGVESIFAQGQSSILSPAIESLAQANPARFFVPPKNRIAGRYLVQFTQDFLRPGILDENPEEEPEAAIAKNTKRSLDSEFKIRRFLAQMSIPPKAVTFTYTHAFCGFAAELTDEQVVSLLAEPAVENIEMEQLFAIDDDLPQTKSYHCDPVELQTKQITTCAISTARGPGLKGPNNTRIWLIDTGVDLDHPDLNVANGNNFSKSFTSATAEDLNGHGTHLAGLAAAKDNTIGVVGMSEGAKICPIKVTVENTKNTTPAIMAAALDHVAKHDHKNDVVNISFYEPMGPNCATFNSALKTAIQNLGASGTFVVMSAGNGGFKIANFLPGCIQNTDKIFTVAGMVCYHSPSFWQYSNYGQSNYGAGYQASVADDIIGSGICSTYLNGSYAAAPGTSQAAAIVSGIIHWKGGPPLNNENVTDPLGNVYPVAKLQ